MSAYKETFQRTDAFICNPLNALFITCLDLNSLVRICNVTTRSLFMFLAAPVDMSGSVSEHQSPIRKPLILQQQGLTVCSLLKCLFLLKSFLLMKNKSNSATFI